MSEDVGSVEFSTTVAWRDSLGRFATAIGTGGEEATLEAAQQGASFAALFAPRDTGAMAASIKPFINSSGVGGWTVGTEAGLPQEFGARPHRIEIGPAGVLANKRKNFYSKRGVNHPGNIGQHFMAAAFDIVLADLMDIVKKHMP